ncbi:Pkinase-domain-containing protein [Dothidotthia symphoricarpi CBS 119687]|uniref:non-specific serine/threonine protein kinase n=1 Tax=Dothidotthia symphoricarpi CBS 119687 TaxID=1392245 RepID=A0A6A6A4V7_9PLEO|nr:Pkinase-domain-containing protein [Dothidotthia symphoricarpi CBS 119687]KAF2125798.1 Pkinase-domain-containing protein [Dothidotthia symphoricarpi CBS 119687]
MSGPHDGSLPEEAHFKPHHAPDHVSLVKNKSTPNLLTMSRAPPAINTAKRLSIDAGQLDRMARSPILPEHEHGLGVSGLRRIRQQPGPRLSTAQRASSLQFATPPASRRPSGADPSAPASPTFAFGEDLTRFPSESLHSFSFATQSEDFIHNRQAVLKRSIDFMRDRLGWAATNPGIANAQAKLSGDQEVQSMMELLTRANLIGQDGAGAHGLGAFGPVTGPADMSGENMFDKSFKDARSDSPDTMLETSRPSVYRATTTDIAGTADKENRQDARSPTDLTPGKLGLQTPQSPSSPKRPQRAALKRTLTDVAPLTLQSQLNDAMAQPYLVGDHGQTSLVTSPTTMPTTSPSFNQSSGPHSAGPAPHGHGMRHAPAAQAIFTTEAQAPWTITAANDLACLVFGVTRAEVRKLGILEVVREDRRKWLEEKLKNPDLGSKVPREAPQPPSQPSHLKVGNGLTARLLSKPSSRVAPGKKAKTDDGSGSSYYNAKKTGKLNHESKGSRGVLLCGDVIPIQKRNGATGAASLWVKEKRGGLIWVLEEIAEDVVHINVDEVGCVSKGWGAVEAVFGSDRLRRGMDLKRLIPGIPRLQGTNTGALDYNKIADEGSYTARTSNSINIPVIVEALPGESTFRISSFPHIAGILVLSSSDLTITSSNSVFSSSLFGQPRPEGIHISKLIPAFDRILHVMTDEDKIELVDGIVIPEHSFRRARALLAMREGSTDAAAIFLRPSGLPAIHHDGSEIMIDVQMRVVKSDKNSRFDEHVIEEEGSSSRQPNGQELVYALWVTYSRQLHATNHGVGLVTPIVSRPGTPPHQPSPGQANIIHPEDAESDQSKHNSPSRPLSLLTQQFQQAGQSSTPREPQTRSSKATSQKDDSAEKKSINDFVVLEEMGQGAYGQVKLCRYKKNSSKKVVIKYVTKRRILVDTWTRDRRLGTVPLEIHVLDYLRRDGFKHSNIVEMSDFFEDDINYYIEMVPHGLPGMDLFDYIELRVNMEEKECRKIFVQVAEAIHHLHTKAKVVHRDIKDENVVLDGEGNIKLIDFGSAAYIKSGPFDVFVGTIDYAAPEVLAGKSYRGKEQDVWALGILLYTIIYKENPFYSIDEIMDHDLRVPWVMSEDSIDLVRMMLDRDVEKRITISQVLEHPWCRCGDGE